MTAMSPSPVQRRPVSITRFDQVRAALLESRVEEFTEEKP
jgi:hypothetical protein